MGAEKSIDEIFREAQEAFQKGNPETALPFLESYVSRAQPAGEAGIARNMIAIIYLTKNQGEEAKTVIEEARKLKPPAYAVAGADVLYAYSCLMTGNAKKAKKVTDNALDLLSKLRFPDASLVAHDLAANTMAQALLKGSDAAVKEFNSWLSCFINQPEYIREGILEQLAKVYGTTQPSQIAQLKPTQEFEHLRWFWYGKYQEPHD